MPPRDRRQRPIDDPPDRPTRDQKEPPPGDRGDVPLRDPERADTIRYASQPIPPRQIGRRSRTSRSEFDGAQAQSVGHHAEGGKRHGGRGDDRRQQKPEKRVEHPGRDGYAGSVIDKGEE